MGLGKTVEVIACILCHPKPSSEHKSLEDSRTTDQNVSGNETNEAQSLTSCARGRSMSMPTQNDHSSQEGMNSSVIKTDCKSLNDSRTAHPYTSVNPENALALGVQDSSINSQPAECKHFGQEGRNNSTLKLDHNSLTKNTVSSIQDCFDSKPIEREICSEQQSHGCKVQPQQRCHSTEQDCDLKDVSCIQNPMSSKTACSTFRVNGGVETLHTPHTVSGENGSFVHEETNCFTTKPGHDFGKNDYHLTGDANCSQNVNSPNISCQLYDDRGCGHVQTVAGEETETETETGEILCGVNSRSDQSKEQETVQDDLEAASLSNSSSTLVEQVATIRCQCICGTTEASCSDKLLQCCGCQAVFHVKCLQYDCPREFLCPHCALKQVRLYYWTYQHADWSLTQAFTSLLPSSWA